MTSKYLLPLCLLAACGKTPTDTPSPKTTDHVAPAAKPAGPDAACAAKVKALEPWLAALELERASYEIGTYPVIDRAPLRVPRSVDAVEITKQGVDAWDVSEHDHASSKLADHATPKQLADFLTQTRAKVAPPDEFEPGPDDLLRIDVSAAASWGDVVRVVDAATKAGYARAVFAFGATSKLEQPVGVDVKTMTEADAKEASDKLDALKSTCKPWGSVALRHTRDKDPAADAAALAKETATAIAECNCAANPDDVRALMWKDARWHQASPTVGITIALGGAAAKTIALPAKTRWADAAAKLADAVPDATPVGVKLTAK